MNETPRTPGKSWPLILGAAGFAAGFLGPMIFIPEANQGPMVGIFVSGPGGVALGLLLLGVCALFKVSARMQWRLLWTTTIVGVVAILLAVQPPPQRQGLIFTAQVVDCVAPAEAEARILEYWNKRISEVTWHEARPGWQEDMRATLRGAPGVLIQVEIATGKVMLMHRKPWNRGKLTASDQAPTGESREYYSPVAHCADYPAGLEITAFQDYLPGGSIEAPDVWPPREFRRFIRAAEIGEVPARFAEFL